MPNIRQYDAGDIGLRPTETGVEARAGAARRIGAFYNQVGGATEQLARVTGRLAGDTTGLGRQMERLGSETAGVGRETERLGSATAGVGRETAGLGRETAGVGRETAGLGRETAGLGRQTEGVGRETEALGAFKERALAGIGRAAGSALQVAGDAAVRYLDHQQMSHGAPALAGLMSGKEQQWNNIVKDADPNDSTAARRFLEGSLEPDIEKFKQSFWTDNARRWAEQHTDAFRQHMYNKTSGDMATLAAQAVGINQRQTINALSSSVRSDPSSLDFTLSTLESTTAATVGSSPNLSGVAASKVFTELMQGGKESIIKSAAIGHIEKTGEVPAWVSDPKYAPYINGAELKMFAGQAKYYQRLTASEDRATRVQQDYEIRKDFHDLMNKLELETMPKNVGDRPQLPADYWQQVRDRGRHPGAQLEPALLKAAITRGEAITARLEKPEPLGRVSHETYMTLAKQIAGIDGPRMTDEKAIFDATDNLTTADFNRLRKEFADAKTPEGESISRSRAEFTKSFAQIIDGDYKFATMQHSLLGTQKMYEFVMDARRQEETLRKEGKDPHLVYDPRKGNPYYWGSPENLARYHISLQEAQTYEKNFKAMDKANFERPAAPDKSTAFVPPSDWQWSPSRRQYRDPNGQIYDDAGKRVKK